MVNYLHKLYFYLVLFIYSSGHKISSHVGETVVGLLIMTETVDLQMRKENGYLTSNYEHL